MNLTLDFTSYNFIFACVVFVLIYYLIPHKVKWIYLLLASACIYTLSSPVCALFLLATITVTYISGLLIERAKGKGAKTLAMLLPLLFDISLLVYAKYTGFLLEIFSKITGSLSESRAVAVIVPMGVSFYTFQSLAYILDVYKSKIKPEKNYFKFMLFISYFPQLIQGPISRFDDLSREIFKDHPFNAKEFAFGAQRVLFGYFKKMVIADRIGILVNTLTSDTETYHGGWFLILLIFYTIELYMDFSGGIDITIGLSRMLGIKVTENFLRPIFSESVAKFWNRWHVTMGKWFRDYIYIPLGGSRVNLGRIIFNFFVVWLTTGIWHGAGYNYILWGLMNFAVIASSKLLDKPYAMVRKALKTDGKKWYRFICCLRTWLLASLFFTMFAYGSLGNALNAAKGLFAGGSLNMLSDGSIFTCGLTLRDYIVIGTGILLVFIIECIEEHDAGNKPVAANDAVLNRIHTLPYPVRVLIWLGLFIAVILLGAYGRGYNAASFIYNRF